MDCCNPCCKVERVEAKELEELEELDQCCGSNAGRRCICLPYDDPFVIASQLLSIVALALSWIWWPAFIISIIAHVLCQIIWCCRQTVASIITTYIISIIAGTLNLFAAIFVLIAWKDKDWCGPFIFHTYKNPNHDDYYYVNNDDYCPEKIWFTIAFVCAFFWFAVAGFLILFMVSGRYAKWEERLCRLYDNKRVSTASEAVEMGNVAIATAASPVQEQSVLATEHVHVLPEDAKEINGL